MVMVMVMVMDEFSDVEYGASRYVLPLPLLQQPTAHSHAAVLDAAGAAARE
jgi:hypothetical protein